MDPATSAIAGMFAKPIAESLVKQFVDPKLRLLASFIRKWQLQNHIDNYNFNGLFEEYLIRTLTSCHYVNTLVYPNHKIPLESVYVPLRLQLPLQGKPVLIDKGFSTKFFEEHNRMLITDTAGMGKSTLMKYLCTKTAMETRRIPILIELRKINESNDILSEMLRQLQPLTKDFQLDVLIKFIERGFFSVFLDGFDEIEREMQGRVIDDIKNLVSRSPKCEFVLTSRPELALSSFGEFQVFHLAPLAKHEAYALIRKYDSHNDSKYAEQLIKEIRSNEDQVAEFLTNPFLVSLLYKSYTYNRDIPTKKSTFYEEVFTCLYKHHDLSKDGFKRPKKSNLDIIDFRIILRAIAFESAKRGVVAYTSNDLEVLISNAKKKSGIDYFKGPTYVDDLVSTVPIFQQDGTKVKWAHKSIQDYFAGEYIVHHPEKVKIMHNLFSSRKDGYLNIIDLVEELDLRLYRRTILLPILEQYVSTYESTYWKSADIAQSDIDLRKSATFGGEYFVTHHSVVGGDQSDWTNVIQSIRTEYPETGAEKNNWSVVGKPFGETEILLVSAFRYESALISMMVGKKENIFRESVSTIVNEQGLQNLPLNRVYRVDDVGDNPLNEPNCFKAVTSFILETRSLFSNARRYWLDITRVRETVKQIQSEIASESDNGDLAGF